MEIEVESSSAKSVIVYLPIDTPLYPRRLTSYQHRCENYEYKLSNVKRADVEKRRSAEILFPPVQRIDLQVYNRAGACPVRSVAKDSQQASYWRWNLKGIKIAYCVVESIHK